jgi:hypothetical protein
MVLRGKSKDWLARDQNNVSERVACIPADNCFSELSLYKDPTQRVGQLQSVHRHHVIKCNLF